MRASRVLLGALSLFAAACTGSSSSAVQGEAEPVPTNPTVRQTTTVPDCSARPLQASADLPADATLASVAVSRQVFECAPFVVVANLDAALVTAAAETAVAATAPLIVVDPTSESHLATAMAEINRLGADRVTFFGPGSALLPASWEITDSATLTTPADLFASSGDGPVWAASDEHLTTALSILPAVTAGGGRVILEGQPSGRPSTEVAVIGDLNPTERWQLLGPGHAPQLPGGGVTVFPGRRIVAYYGSPVTFRLGLLGERGPEETLAELEALAEEYAIPGGDPVIPGFEIIATVADSKPGNDGDYSNELTTDQMREWVDLASVNGAFVIIDLQPGRTDFLTQARRYEEFLRLPNVGLALDPEWRLEPDEEHLRQIGSVDAAEVNDVVSWLAELVREEMLPQKILVLHQFNLQMITNRELISTPPELAVVVHVDGQGPLGSKYGTYETVLGAPIGPEQTLWWGWKNFVDEDFPTALPSQVNNVDPLPVIITYQ